MKTVLQSDRSVMEHLGQTAWRTLRSLLICLAAFLFAEIGTHLAWGGMLSAGGSPSTIALIPIHALVTSLAVGIAAVVISRGSRRWVIVGLGVGIFVGVIPHLVMKMLGSVYDVPVGAGSLMIQFLESAFILAVSLLGARLGRQRSAITDRVH